MTITVNEKLVDHLDHADDMKIIYVQNAIRITNTSNLKNHLKVGKHHRIGIILANVGTILIMIRLDYYQTLDPVR